MKDKQTVYDVITSRIIQALESDTIPWRQPWKGGAKFGPRNLITEYPYRGINQIMTGCQPYADQRWVTFNQLRKIPGAMVNKGEKATPIVFWMIKDTKDEKTGEKKKIFAARYYNVFNVAQCNLPEEFLQIEKVDDFDPISEAEKVISSYKNAPTLRDGYSHACYIPSVDAIEMPYRGSFKEPERFYATLFHEMTHSTGHASRLNREGITERHYFGDELYSKEELVAEMGAAMLCGVSGIDNSILPHSAAYIRSWLNALKNDSKLVIQAAARAQKACDFILGKTFSQESEE